MSDRVNKLKRKLSIIEKSKEDLKKELEECEKKVNQYKELWIMEKKVRMQGEFHIKYLEDRNVHYENKVKDLTEQKNKLKEINIENLHTFQNRLDQIKYYVDSAIWNDKADSVLRENRLYQVNVQTEFIDKQENIDLDILTTEEEME